MAQRSEEVLVLDVADNQTILAGDPIKVNTSGQAQRDTSDFSGDTRGVALTDATFTTVASEGIRKKLGIMATGRYTFTGLVENDDSGTYTSNIRPGTPVGAYWSSGVAYVVNNTSNPIGTAQESLVGNEDTTVEIEGVGTIAATGLTLNNAPTSGSVAIWVPDKVFTVTQNASSASDGVCDVNTTTGVLVFYGDNATNTYSGQQVYSRYDYDANTDATGDVEVRVSFLPKDSVISAEIAPNAIDPTDLNSAASFIMGGLTVNNTTGANVTVLNNLSVGGTIYANINDTTFGDIMMSSANITGAGTALVVTNNVSAGGNIVAVGNVSATNFSGNITDTTFGDITIGTADFTGAGTALEVTNNVSVAGDLTVDGTITGEIADLTFENVTVSQANITGAGTSLIVNNNISAGGTVSGSNIDDTEWDNATTVLSNNSTGWENVESTVNTNSTGWENVESIVNTNSAGWESTETTVDTNSGGWEAVESTVNTNSAGWEAAESTLNTNSADWVNVETTVSNNSVGWESTETTVSNTSTNWNTAYTHSTDSSQAHSDYLINNGNDTTSGHLVASGNITTAPVLIGVDNTTNDAGTVVLRDSNGTDYYKIQVLGGVLTTTLM